MYMCMYTCMLCKGGYCHVIQNSWFLNVFDFQVNAKYFLHTYRFIDMP